MSWGGIRFVESIVIGAYFIDFIPVNLCWLVPRHKGYVCVEQEEMNTADIYRSFSCK